MNIILLSGVLNNITPTNQNDSLFTLMWYEYIFGLNVYTMAIRFNFQHISYSYFRCMIRKKCAFFLSIGSIFFIIIVNYIHMLIFVKTTCFSYICYFTNFIVQVMKFGNSEILFWKVTFYCFTKIRYCPHFTHLNYWNVTSSFIIRLYRFDLRNFNRRVTSILLFKTDINSEHYIIFFRNFQFFLFL